MENKKIVLNVYDDKGNTVKHEINTEDVKVLSGPVLKIMKLVDVNAIVEILADESDNVDIGVDVLGKIITQALEIFNDIVIDDILLFNFKDLSREDLDRVEIGELIEAIKSIVLVVIAKYSHLIKLA